MEQSRLEHIVDVALKAGERDGPDGRFADFDERTTTLIYALAFTLHQEMGNDDAKIAGALALVAEQLRENMKEMRESWWPLIKRHSHAPPPRP